MNEFGLPEETMNQILSVFKKHDEILKVKIYGSRAMGNYRIGSDIDLAVYLKDNTDYLFIGSLLYELDELPTPYMFDVTDYYKISHQPLKDHIDEFGKIIYTKV